MPTLTAYHRPASIDEALHLLTRPGINTTILAGGSYIMAHMPETVSEVVDLQAIDSLHQLSIREQRLVIGAMVRLQTIVDHPQAPPLLREAAQREGPNTLRNAATIGGIMASPNKESEMLAALLIFEADVQIQTSNGQKQVPLTNFLRDIPTALGGGLITSVSIMPTGQTASARVARTPADRPIVAALARQDEHGQIRLALCGVDNLPVLVDPETVKSAVNPPNDFRGSTEYRRHMAATLSRRVVNELSEKI
jgi:CO/xanthine dehydrogenase FAD-binding subunit